MFTCTAFMSTVLCPLRGRQSFTLIANYFPLPLSQKKTFFSLQLLACTYTCLSVQTTNTSVCQVMHPCIIILDSIIVTEEESLIFIVQWEITICWFSSFYTFSNVCPRTTEYFESCEIFTSAEKYANKLLHSARVFIFLMSHN